MTWEAVAPAGPVAPSGAAADERPGRGAAYPAAPDSPPGQIRAPLVGTFYRAAEPGAAPFVSVGDIVEAGQQVAIVESMKLMNPIETETAGQVVEILVQDGAPVEYDQPLMVISPSGDAGCAALFPGASTPQEEPLVGGGR
ncbi:acetyl-CoA carboxylase biotin carboxyl carrier protein [Microbispora hainanensis]|uniref:Biotin carboxyl carrier protein of acetyl-CoA carboxylase n=2 Tax=Microbispora hainanensis TaxID=568844 RepID=A0A544Z2V9_9ACTN|nr:acetyl-CoA carboxylase biotin carboxyl carrier protein [Microbispora hainanensis]